MSDMAIHDYVITKPSDTKDCRNFVATPQAFIDFVSDHLKKEERVLHVVARLIPDELAAIRGNVSNEEVFELRIVELFAPKGEFQLTTQDVKTNTWITIQVGKEVRFSIVTD